MVGVILVMFSYHILPTISQREEKESKEDKLMDFTASLLALTLGLVYIYVLIHYSNRRGRPSTARLPPGPYPFPIIGNIFQLGHKPHHSLTILSKTYGPLMSLQLGSITTVVVSSPKMAKEVLQKHDQTTPGRTIPDAARALDHHKVSKLWLPVEKKWRNLRKICKEHLFTVQRLNASQHLRTLVHNIP
ncbi:unnamed protein product [Ilex paraguariensis]|uniref:Cytochrome P450 n=1 Tax=Ilex paraguariensis TaxID=185542 RepID=A0ABC8QWY1_9AQUA